MKSYTIEQIIQALAWLDRQEEEQVPARITPLAPRLDAVVKGKEDSVNNFLVARGYIKLGETYHNVSDDIALRIIQNTKSFLDKVSERDSF